MSLATLIAAALVVVDGDTLRDPETGVRLRLAAIDAPEHGHRADCPAEATLAIRATARLADLVPGAQVIFSGRTDRWGRPLVALMLPDGRTASEVLVGEGLAVPWDGAQHEWCPAIPRPVSRP